MKKVDKHSLSDVLDLVRDKLSRDPQAACGLFYSDEPPIYILPPNDDDNDGPIYILPPKR